MLDLNDVALFVRVVEAGSFSRAARSLDLPPNTVSRRIRALEEQLGVRLLQRSTRRLTPTAAGTALHARSAGSIEALHEAARALAQDVDDPAGTIRIAAPVDFFTVVPIAWVADFAAAHPRVDLEFRLDDARADLLGDGIDVAFRGGRLLEPTLVARRVGSTDHVLMASPAYLDAHGTPHAIDDLREHHGLILRTASARGSWRLDGPGGPVEVKVRPRFAANAIGALVGAALAGLGIALLPRQFATRPVEHGALVQVLPGWGVHEVGLNLVYLSGRQQPAAVRAFIDFIVGRMNEPPDATDSPVIAAPRR